MSYEDAENIAIGQLASSLHFELTGQRLQLFELPCHEALMQAMETLRARDTAVIDLLNEA